MKRIALSPLRSRRFPFGGTSTPSTPAACATPRPPAESRLSAQRALAVAGLASFAGVFTAHAATYLNSLKN